MTAPKQWHLEREHADIMQHTRDNAAGGFYCGDSPAMQELVAAGLMAYAGRKSFAPDPYFQLTRAGRTALRAWIDAQPPPPKPKRRRQTEAFEGWRAYCESFKGISFGRFWKEIWPQRRQWL